MSVNWRDFQSQLSEGQIEKLEKTERMCARLYPGDDHSAGMFDLAKTLVEHANEPPRRRLSAAEAEVLWDQLAIAAGEMPVGHQN